MTTANLSEQISFKSWSSIKPTNHSVLSDLVSCFDSHHISNFYFQHSSKGSTFWRWTPGLFSTSSVSSSAPSSRQSSASSSSSSTRPSSSPTATSSPTSAPPPSSPSSSWYSQGWVWSGFQEICNIFVSRSWLTCFQKSIRSPFLRPFPWGWLFGSELHSSSPSPPSALGSGCSSSSRFQTHDIFKDENLSTKLNFVYFPNFYLHESRKWKQSNPARF